VKQFKQNHVINSYEVAIFAGEKMIEIPDTKYQIPDTRYQ